MTWDWPIAKSDPRVAYADEHVLLLHSRWQDVIGELGTVDAVITDPPYSERTHKGHRNGVGSNTGDWRGVPTTRRVIDYSMWSPADVALAVDAWAGCRGWIVALTDSELVPAWRDAYRFAGRVAFQPLPCVMKAMTVRLNGDGPSSWAVYAVVGRTPALSKWGTLPGAYVGNCQRGMDVVGGKPLWLMRELVRDYSREGDLILDPCAGAGTTGRAAKDLGRRCILIEQDADTVQKAIKVLRPHRAWQLGLLDDA